MRTARLVRAAITATALLFSSLSTGAPPARSAELSAAVRAVTSRCPQQRDVDLCWAVTTQCADQAGASDVGAFQACMDQTPYGNGARGELERGRQQEPASLLTPLQRGTRMCADTRLPGVMFGQPVQRRAHAIAFVEDLAGDRIKLSIAGVQIVGPTAADAQSLRITGLASYRGTPLQPGGVLWIDSSNLGDWQTCE